MNFMRKSMMFILSFFPLYILIIIMNFQALKDAFFMGDYLSFIIILAFFLISVTTLIIFMKLPAMNSIDYRSIRVPKDGVISYIFTYIIPLVSADINKPETIVANLFLFFLVWLLYVRLNLFYLNPILVLFGYISYEVDDKIIITNIPYHRLLHTNHLRGSYFTNDIFIAKKIDNK